MTDDNRERRDRQRKKEAGTFLFGDILYIRQTYLEYRLSMT